MSTQFETGPTEFSFFNFSWGLKTPVFAEYKIAKTKTKVESLALQRRVKIFNSPIFDQKVSAQSILNYQQNRK